MRSGENKISSMANHMNVLKKLIFKSINIAESNRLITLGALVALKVDILNTLKEQLQYAF